MTSVSIGSKPKPTKDFTSLKEIVNTLDELKITKLTNELNRQSLMVGYIDAFKLYAWVGFLSIPLIFLIKVKKKENK